MFLLKIKNITREPFFSYISTIYETTIFAYRLQPDLMHHSNIYRNPASNWIDNTTKKTHGANDCEYLCITYLYVFSYILGHTLMNKYTTSTTVFKNEIETTTIVIFVKKLFQVDQWSRVYLHILNVLFFS